MTHTLFSIICLTCYAIALWHPLKTFTTLDERTKQTYMIGGVVWALLGVFMEVIWIISYMEGV